MPACQAKLVCQCEWECDPSSWDRQVDGSPLQGLADGLIYRFPGMPCAATSYTKKIERKMEASKQSDVKTKMKRCVSMWIDGARDNWQHWPSSVVLVMIDQGRSPRHVQVGHHARPWKRWDLVALTFGFFSLRTTRSGFVCFFVYFGLKSRHSSPSRRAVRLCVGDGTGTCIEKCSFPLPPATSASIIGLEHSIWSVELNKWHKQHASFR